MLELSEIKATQPEAKVVKAIEYEVVDIRTVTNEHASDSWAVNFDR